MNTKIRLLLADDSGEFRALLQKNLEEHPEIQVVGAAGDGEELVQLSSQLSPDIILTDTVLSKLDGLAAIRASPAPLPERNRCFSFFLPFPATRWPPKPQPWASAIS